MKRGATTVIMLLLLACGAAQASQWVLVGENLKKIKSFVDVSNIQIAGEIRRAWTKDVFVPHTQRGMGEHSRKWIDHLVSYEAYNCAEGTNSTQALALYFDDGTNSLVPASALPSP